MESIKLDLECFINIETVQYFSCVSCNKVPLENQLTCNNCGQLFCTECIRDLYNYSCSKCLFPSDINAFKNVQQNVNSNIFNFEYRCQTCDSIITLDQYNAHKLQCKSLKCQFYACNKGIKKGEEYILEMPNKVQIYFCSVACKYSYLIKGFNNMDKDKFESEIKDLVIQLINDNSIHDSCPNNKSKKAFDKHSFLSKIELKNQHPFDVSALSNSDINKGLLDNSELIMSDNGECFFTWDPFLKDDSVLLSNENRSVFLNESGYFFRNVISNKYCFSGVFYWEILADERSENELKIGVTLTKELDIDKSFSDKELGFAFYGVGQLRNGSKITGVSYGKEFKNGKGDILGVCLDMNKGTLSFAKNNQFFGIAFQSNSLKKPPIYPAVSLMHKAGFTLVVGKPLPIIFKI